MLKIKDLIMLFSTTLRNYGYVVKPLWELLLEIREHYNEVLMQRWVQVFREILDQESFLPIQVVIVHFIVKLGLKQIIIIFR